jgi:indole-3-glycerol phosphate synthase
VRARSGPPGNLVAVPASPTYLDRILAAHRQAAADDRRAVEDLQWAARHGGPVRGFAAALRARDGLAVIAEVKRRSPSKGDLDASLDPGEVAADYERGGAACMSVLTDEGFFGGSAADLQAARAACSLPVLRKDFTVSPADVYDARAMGADAVLLIVAALSDAELAELHALAASLGMDSLVEVHDEPELERALAVGATLVGVNQRDLVTFAVDTDRALRMAQRFPPRVTAVAESGIDGPASAARLGAAGYHAVLVGETLVRSADRAAAVAALRSGVSVPS